MGLWFEDFLPSRGAAVAATSKEAGKPEYKRLAYPEPACSEKEFLRHVEKHEMKIQYDDGGVNRRIVFADPQNSNQWFELVTWEHRLCFTGDMGTYVFSRIPDMYAFFRGRAINPGYWAEKCIAADRDGVKEWSADHFKARVYEWLSDAEVSQEVYAAVEQEVIGRADDGEVWAMTALHDFESDGWRFEDWESDCKTYTYCFLWCLYAIVWGIAKYDESLQQQAAAQAA